MPFAISQGQLFAHLFLPLTIAVAAELKSEGEGVIDATGKYALPGLIDVVNKGRLSLQQLIRLTSENPAAVFGIKVKFILGARSKNRLVYAERLKKLIGSEILQTLQIFLLENVV